MSNGGTVPPTPNTPPAVVGHKKREAAWEKAEREAEEHAHAAAALEAAIVYTNFPSLKRVECTGGIQRTMFRTDQGLLFTLEDLQGLYDWCHAMAADAEEEP